MSEERLDKLMSAAGQFTRSEARALIRSGAVTVDGVPVRRPEEKVSRQSAVEARGVSVDTAEFAYWMLNKPAGYVSASKDELWPAVTRLLPEEARRRNVFCVGRLDADVTGLLILTDDGDYAHRVTAPRAQIRKVYRVLLDTPVGPEDAERLARGAVWSDGTAYRPAVLQPEPAQPRSALVAVTEGKYHEVKRLMALCGHRVLSMSRLSIGGLSLDLGLREGEARRMTPEEAFLVFDKNVEVNL